MESSKQLLKVIQWNVGEILLILECIGIKQDTFKWSLNWAEYFINYFQVLNFSDLDKWYFVNYLLDCLFMWKVIALTSNNFAFWIIHLKKQNKCTVTYNIEKHTQVIQIDWLLYWCLTIISTTFQLYRGDQFYWWASNWFASLYWTLHVI